MNNNDIHDRSSRNREYYGQSEAKPLLDWLNSTSTVDPTGVGRARVRNLVEMIQRLYANTRSDDADGKHRRSPKVLETEIKRINALLIDYRFSYALDPSQSSSLAWTIRGSKDLKGIDDRKEIDDEEELDPSLPEILAVFCVVALTKQGVLGSIRRCECGKYFFARLPAQRFHDDNCRVVHWENSPERKLRRREKAREYYNLHKSGKVK